MAAYIINPAAIVAIWYQFQAPVSSIVSLLSRTVTAAANNLFLHAAIVASSYEITNDCNCYCIMTFP